MQAEHDHSSLNIGAAKLRVHVMACTPRRSLAGIAVVCLYLAHRRVAEAPPAAADLQPPTEFDDASDVIDDEMEDEGDVDPERATTQPEQTSQELPEAQRAPARVRLRRERLDVEPLNFRRGRKRITELTSITKLKSATNHTEEPENTADASPAHSTLTWLADRIGLHRPRPEATAEEVVVRRQRRQQRRRRKQSHRATAHDNLCIELQRRHGVTSDTWGTLPLRQHRSWNELHCNERVQRLTSDAAASADGAESGAGGAKGGAAAPQMTAAHRDRQRAQRRRQWQRPSVDSGVDGGDSHAGEGLSSASATCERLATAHAVIVGVSWGTLPLHKQGEWTELECDRALAHSPRHLATHVAVQTPQIRAMAGAPDARGDEQRQQAQSCLHMQRRHGVVIGSSWGTLPPPLQAKWTRLDCDHQV